MSCLFANHVLCFTRVCVCVGEAYDKTARLLGLPVGGGGGPFVERLAQEGNPKAVPLPVPLQKRKHDCDFSYAGLKTAVRAAAEKLVDQRGVASVTDLPHPDKANLAASFQHVAIRHIEERLVRAMQWTTTSSAKQDDANNKDKEQIRTLAVVGGVAANQELRQRLQNICHDAGWDMVVPPPRLCTDQGTMSAWAAIERLMVKSSDVADTQQVYARYPFSLVTTTNEETVG